MNRFRVLLGAALSVGAPVEEVEEEEGMFVVEPRGNSSLVLVSVVVPSDKTLEEDEVRDNG